MKRSPTLPIAVTCAVLLGACGKVQEAATEKAAEKMIEASMSKDGTQAKVDLSQGGLKMSTTDASGKTTQMELGSAKLTEADLGLPFYPGSQPKEGSSMRIANGANVSMQQGLHSDDPPDKVAAFYRDKLKAMAEGKQLMDMSSNDGASMSLIDDKAKRIECALHCLVDEDPKLSAPLKRATKSAGGRKKQGDDCVC